MKKKPSFQADITYFESELSADQCNEIARLLPKKMPKKQQAEFLKILATEISAYAAESEASSGLTPKEIRKDINTVLKQARKLRESLEGLDGIPFRKLNFNFRQLVRYPNPPIALPYREKLARENYRLADLFRLQIELVEGFEVLAEYTISEIHTSKDTMKNKSNRDFVARIVKVYRTVTGELPPKTENSWFPGFVQKLAEISGTGCKPGADIIESTIDKITLVETVFQKK